MSEHQPIEIERPPSSQTSVLVVEDDEDLASAVQEILIDEGFRVAHASNGQAALELLAMNAEFCAILLDVRMPVMDGVEFRRRQLEDPRIARIPVVAFAADPRERAEIASLGVARQLSKPVRLDDMIETIDHLCPDRSSQRPPRRLAV